MPPLARAVHRHATTIATLAVAMFGSGACADKADDKDRRDDRSKETMKSAPDKPAEFRFCVTRTDGEEQCSPIGESIYMDFNGVSAYTSGRLGLQCDRDGECAAVIATTGATDTVIALGELAVSCDRENTCRIGRDEAHDATLRALVSQSVAWNIGLSTPMSLATFASNSEKKTPTYCRSPEELFGELKKRLRRRANGRCSVDRTRSSKTSVAFRCQVPPHPPTCPIDYEASLWAEQDRVANGKKTGYRIRGIAWMIEQGCTAETEGEVFEAPNSAKAETRQEAEVGWLLAFLSECDSQSS